MDFNIAIIYHGEGKAMKGKLRVQKQKLYSLVPSIAMCSIVTLTEKPLDIGLALVDKKLSDHKGDLHLVALEVVLKN